MTDHVSTLRIDLTGNLSAEARASGEAMLRMAADAKKLDEQLAASGGSKQLQERLRSMGAGAKGVEAVTVAMRQYAEAEGLAASRGDWTREQVAGVKNLERTIVAAQRAELNGAKAVAEQERRLQQEQAAEAKRAADREIAERRRVAEEAERDARREVAARQRAHEREIAEERRHAERIIEQRREMQHRMGFGHYVAGSVAAGVSAHGVMSGIERAAEAGSELQDTRLALQRSGVDAGTRAQMERQALDLSTKYGNVGMTAIMDLQKEARSVLRDPKEVAGVVETLARAKAALDAGGGHSEGLGALVKGAESIGAANDPERLAKLIDGYVKAIQVMGKTISPEQIYEFDKYAKTAGATMSDRFLMTTGLSLSQEMGGSTAANDIFHAQKDITGGFQNKHIPLKEMARLGLLARGDIETLPGTGENKGVRAGARGVVGKELAQTDLDQWVYRHLLPAMEEHGIRTTQAQIAEINKIFTGGEADVISKLVTQRESFENHAMLYGGAEGLAAAEGARGQASAGIKAVTEALGNLMGTATVGLMEPAAHVLFTVADGLNALARAAAANPGLASGAFLAGGAAALYGAGKVGQMVMNGFGGGAAAAEQVTAAGTQMTAAELQLEAAGKNAAGGVASTVREALKDAGLASRGLGVGSALAEAAPAVIAGGIAVGVVGLVKKSAEAQEPGKGGQWSAPTADTLADDEARLADQRAEIDRINAEIARNKAQERLPGSADTLNANLVQQLGQLQGQEKLLADRLEALRAQMAAAPPGGSYDWSGLYGTPRRATEEARARAAGSALPRAEAPAAAPAPGDDSPGYVPIAYREGDDGVDRGPVEGQGVDSRLELAVAAGTEAGVLAAFAKMRAEGASLAAGGVLNASLEAGGADGAGPGGVGLSRSAPSIRYGRQHSGAGGGGDVGGSASAMGGDEAQRRDRAMAKLQGLGWSREAAAAAIGNAQQESGIRSDGPLGDTARFGTGDDAAHGMFQWRGSRFRALEAFAAKKGTNWKDFDTQVEFFDQESRRYGSGDWRKTGDVVEANRGMQRFEGYGDKSFGTRLANARQILAGKSGGGFYAAAPGAEGAPGGGAAPTGDAVAIANKLMGASSGEASRALHHVMTAGLWCADFVNGTIEAAGGRGSGSSAASSFASWGKAVAIADAKRGDVIMENSGKGTRVHHAGMVESVDHDAQGRVTGIHMISGNYGHKVSRNLEPFGIIAGLRRGNVGPSEAERLSRAHADPEAGAVPRARAAPRPTAHDLTAGLDEPVGIFDHGNIHGAINAVRQLKREVASLGDASVSVVHGPRSSMKGRPTADMGRRLRAAPASNGTRVA